MRLIIQLHPAIRHKQDISFSTNLMYNRLSSLQENCQLKWLLKTVVFC